MRKNKTDVDELDFRILSALLSQGNLSNKDLSLKVNAHQNTVMQRVRKLQEAHVIRKYTVDVDYSMLGYDYQAVVMLRTKKSKENSSLWELEEIMKMPQVVALYAVSGPYDAVAIVRVRNREEMVNILKKMQEKGTIPKTNSQIVLQMIKDPNQYRPF